MYQSLAQELRAHVIVTCLLLVASAMLALMSPTAAGTVRGVSASRSVLGSSGFQNVSSFQEEVRPADGAVDRPAASVAAPAPSPSPSPTGRSLAAYQGLGAWVDQFDFGKPGTLSAELIVGEISRRGVKTLYVQTGKWNTNVDLMFEPDLAKLLELSHAAGISVVGWYLPGFGDIDTDVRRSMAVINYRTPSGHRFDGFAPDIEDRIAVGKDLGRFNAGIAEYSRRLRESAGPQAVLGAIVVDAKNNKRAPSNWAGFPWPQIATYYDIILPMAYWSVTKKSSECHSVMDVASYQREVVAETNALMGVAKPFHLIGGIADCNPPEEIAAFVNVNMELGTVGGSLYDFWTTEKNPSKELVWAELGRLNQLAPPALLP